LKSVGMVAYLGHLSSEAGGNTITESEGE